MARLDELDRPACICRWNGEELIPSKHCYYHGTNGTMVAIVSSTEQTCSARSVKLHDRFIGTPFEHAAAAVEQADAPYGLTRREIEIILYAFDYSLVKKQVAAKLGIKRTTLSSHWHLIYKKMGVHSAAQVVAKWAYEQGLPTKSDEGAGMEDAPHDN